MKEKRKFSRISSHDKAVLQEENGSCEARLLDLSPGGMKVLLNNKIRIGSHISGAFKIIPDSGGPFYVSGEVVWVKPSGKKPEPASFEVGIKFCKVSTIPL